MLQTLFKVISNSCNSCIIIFAKALVTDLIVGRLTNRPIIKSASQVATFCRHTKRPALFAQTCVDVVVSSSVGLNNETAGA